MGSRTPRPRDWLMVVLILALLAAVPLSQRLVETLGLVRAASMAGAVIGVLLMLAAFRKRQ